MFVALIFLLSSQEWREDGSEGHPKPASIDGGMCLAWSLSERTERGVYAASSRRNPGGVALLPERRESADGEAA